MNYWLMKSEPSEFSIDDLQEVRRERWDGIRNYQVRNMLRDEMRQGDVALFYHSNAGKETGVVGIMEIAGDAYPDPTQFDSKSVYYDSSSSTQNPRWLCVDVTFKKKLIRPVFLINLKQIKEMSASPLIKKGNRLSVVELSKKQFDAIVSVAH